MEVPRLVDAKVVGNAEDCVCSCVSDEETISGGGLWPAIFVDSGKSILESAGGTIDDVGSDLVDSGGRLNGNIRRFVAHEAANFGGVEAIDGRSLVVALDSDNFGGFDSKEMCDGAR
jgi:hypothetical protein